MRRLLLLRHAKTQPSNDKGDHARELISRGRNDSELMGHCLRDGGYEPDLVLCSTSARTRETWEIVQEELGGAPKVQFLDSLYLAPSKAIAAVVRGAPDTAKSLLVVGHNPGLEEFADALARKPESPEERAHLENMREKFPTAALAVFDLDIAQWRDLAHGTGALVAYVRPKYLREE